MTGLAQADARRIGRPQPCEDAASAAQRPSPRPVIRGESTPDYTNTPRLQQANVDWLNFTFAPSRSTQQLLIAHLSKIMRRPVTGVDEGKGLRGYQSSVKLFAHVGSRKQEIGFLAYGGASQEGTWMFSLSGAGCSLIDDWQGMARWLMLLSAKITRLDLCVDFLNGEFTVDDAVSFYREGRFTSRGRSPSTSSAGDWLNGHSRTLYIGRAINGKTLRIYEKGHQLGQPDSKWCRFEVQFGCRDRVIPLEALIERDKFFAGAYPVLADLLDSECGAEKIPTTRTGGEVTLSHLLTHLRRTYGKAIDAMSATQGFDSASLVEEVRVVGVPRRLNITALASGPTWSGICDQSKRVR